MFDVAMGRSARRGTTLSLVTDRTSELVERMTVVIRVVRQR
jgi:hypothetical protein